MCWLRRGISTGVLFIDFAITVEDISIGVVSNRSRLNMAILTFFGANFSIFRNYCCPLLFGRYFHIVYYILSLTGPTGYLHLL